MNNYEDWAQLVAKKIKGEADVIAAIEKNELDDAAAADAFSRALLEPFLPENFGIGSGRVIDAFGNCSDYLDIIVYDRNFPRIEIRGTQTTYLYESVLAGFAVRAKFVRKTFFDSLNASASLSHLETRTDAAALVKLASRNGMKMGPNNRFVHNDALRTARFELIGRPPVFVFGFSGIKNSYRQLQENIELWIANRHKVGIATPMKSLPAVIATQGCFAWRNAAPLTLSNREMLGIGNDGAPLRLIVLQLLYLLSRRLNVTADSYGLKPCLKGYLSQFSAPKFEVGIGNLADIVDLKRASTPTASKRAARDTMRFEPARDYAASDQSKAAPSPKTGAEPAAKTKSAPKPKVVAEAAAPKQKTKKPAAKSAPSKTPAAQATFAKPSPFASAPVPPTKDPAPKTVEEPSSSVPVAPLGSAPIPPMHPVASTGNEPAPAKTIPQKPPVDIDLGKAADEQQTGDEDNFRDTVIVPPGEDDFSSTVVMAPNPSPTDQDTTSNSTDAFIARVKQQLSSSESAQGGEQDFSSTIPQ